MTFSIIYRALDRTLTDKEVDNIHNSIVNILENTYNIIVRKQDL
jgi:phenylalanyl-tRNA synthetase beta subunit